MLRSGNRWSALALTIVLLAGCGGGGEPRSGGEVGAGEAGGARSPEASPVDALPAADVPAEPPAAPEPQDTGAPQATAGSGAAGEAAPGESVPPPLERVQVFLVRVAGEGEEAGPGTFGCGDRLVGVTVPVATAEATTADRVAAAVRFLLASGGGPEAPGDLYNALERSRLEVAAVRFAPGMEEDEGIYRVELSGELRLGGVCDNPRVTAQLRATAEQFRGVEEAELYLDGRPLEAVLTGR
ncbi:MAG TPA: GerMN domain-containing protein [Thermoanaerobaculia bacterium]|nr:GerMN domain-containing protein [Thermoanaerobaculia bacterium]